MDKQWIADIKKLRLTKTQWKTILKWALYIFCLIATLMIQSVILSRLPVFGVKVNLVPFFIGCVCVIEGPDSGSVFALLASLTWALSGGDFGFVSILILTCGGMGVGLLMHDLLQKRLLTCVVLCFLLCLFHDTAIFLLRLFLQTVTTQQYFRILVLGTLLGALSCPVFYYLFRAIHRIGGYDAWNE